MAVAGFGGDAGAVSRRKKKFGRLSFSRGGCRGFSITSCWQLQPTAEAKPALGI